MGSYNEVETCELVGCFLLSQLKEIPGLNIGLYRADGLVVLDQTPKETEQIKKGICKIFARNKLKIALKVNKKVLNFLDLTLNLNTGRFKLYAKQTNMPLYVHSKSNHPPNIIKTFKNL